MFISSSKIVIFMFYHNKKLFTATTTILINISEHVFLKAIFITEQYIEFTGDGKIRWTLQ